MDERVAAAALRLTMNFEATSAVVTVPVIPAASGAAATAAAISHFLFHQHNNIEQSALYS